MRQVRRADVALEYEPDEPNSEKLTFECQNCENEAIEVVKFPRLRVGHALDALRRNRVRYRTLENIFSPRIFFKCQLLNT